MRTFSSRTLGSTRPGGRQRTGILGIKSSVRQRSASSLPLRRRRRSTFVLVLDCCGYCRSFGVVLWEMLTHEIPYKDVDSSAVIWGVGSNCLHLPVPSTGPDGLKLLMRQCWCVSLSLCLCVCVSVCFQSHVAHEWGHT